MLAAIIIILIVLWFLGYGPITALSVSLFNIYGRTITLWDILIFFVVLYILNILPSPFRQIAGVLYILWILSTLGVFGIPGLASLLVIAIIVGAVISIL